MLFREIIATIAALCVTVGYIPQIIKGFKTKSLKDVSAPFLIIIGVGVALWAFYGRLIRDPPLMIANIVILTFIIVLLSMKFYYQRRS